MWKLCCWKFANGLKHQPVKFIPKTVEKLRDVEYPQLKASRIVAQLAAVEIREGGYMAGRYKVGPEPIVINGVITAKRVTGVMSPYL